MEIFPTQIVYKPLSNIHLPSATCIDANLLFFSDPTSSRHEFEGNPRRKCTIDAEMIRKGNSIENVDADLGF